MPLPTVEAPAGQARAAAQAAEELKTDRDLAVAEIVVGVRATAIDLLRRWEATAPNAEDAPNACPRVSSCSSIRRGSRLEIEPPPPARGSAPDRHRVPEVREMKGRLKLAVLVAVLTGLARWLWPGDRGW